MPADDGDVASELCNRPNAATTFPPLGPSLVNESSDDVDAGTATVALLKSDKPDHAGLVHPGHRNRASRR